MPIVRFVWGPSGAGVSRFARELAEREGFAWVGANALAHVSLLRGSVRDELAVGLEQRGVQREEMAELVDRALADWGLARVADRDPLRLSTGQVRRLVIAGALVAGPSGVVLDCPCDGLDVGAVRRLGEVLRGLSVPVVIVDRRLTELARVAERVELIEGGVVADVEQLLAGSRGVGGSGELSGTLSGAEREPIGGGDIDGAAGLAAGRPAVVQVRDAVLRGGSVGPLNLTVPSGSVVHVAGVNGSGKTSLMRAIAGLLPVDAGSVQVLGEQGALGVPVLGNAAVGWVPTEMDGAVVRRTVREEIAVGVSALGGLKSAVGRARVEAVLEQFGLMEVAERHPLDVPSAVRRRVMIGAACVRGPKLLLLDEPTVGMDEEGLGWLGRFVRDFAAGRVCDWSVLGATEDSQKFSQEKYLRGAGGGTVLWSCHEHMFAQAVSDFSESIALS